MNYHRIMIVRKRFMALVASAAEAFRLERQQSADKRAIPTPPWNCLRRHQLHRTLAELICYHLMVGVEVSSTYETTSGKQCCLFPKASDQLLTYGVRQFGTSVWRVRVHNQNVLGGSVAPGFLTTIAT